MPSAVINKPIPRRWPRWSLRSLLLVTAGAAVVCAWLYYEREMIQTKREAVHVLTSQNAHVKLSPSPADWFYSLLGDEMPGKVLEVAMGGDNLPEQFAALVQLPDLESLDFFDELNGNQPLPTLPKLKHFTLAGHAPDKCLQGLARSPLLESLVIRGGNLNGDFLQYVQHCQHLKHVRLQTPATDHSLKALIACPKLESLDLCHTKVSDAGLDHVAQMTNLEYLRLNGLDVTDAGLAKLKNLKQLKTLHLRYCSYVTDAGVKHLAAIGRLESLEIGPSITDASIPEFAALPALKTLEFWQTPITQDAIATLKSKRPDIDIFEAGPAIYPNKTAPGKATTGPR